jgi:hypothetical protein
MGEPETQVKTPIKSKSAYLKILFLRDKKKYEGKPVYYRPIRGSDKLEAVYDYAVFYFFTLYGIDKPQRYTWQFTSSEGKIDDVFQLYPFDATKYDADPSKKDNLRVWDRIIIPKTDGVVVVAHYYNAFQREVGEWAGARAEKDISELRLVIDFSSVITIPGKESLLFKRKPTASLADPVEKTTRALELEYDSGIIFSVAKSNVPEGSVLQFAWQLNWDNLGLWQGSTGEEDFTPTSSKFHEGFRSPYDNTTI